MRDSGDGRGTDGRDTWTSAGGRNNRRITCGRWFWPAFGASLAVATAVTVLAARFAELPGDLALFNAVQGLRTAVLDYVMLTLTLIGFESPAFLVVVLAAAMLWSLRLRLAAVVALLILVGDLIGSALKVVVARPRPPMEFLHLVTPRPDFGFPSGHALHAALFYGFLAYICWRHVNPRIWRVVLTTALVVLALLTGLSRVYLGAHWPSDVVGGFLIGLVLLLGTIKLYEVVESRMNGARK